MLDPQLFRVIAFGLGLLFLFAGLHKLQNRTRFGSVLENYRIIPEFLLPVMLPVIPVLELVLSVSWFIQAMLRAPSLLLPVVSAGLLSTYGAAIAANLLRGRKHIDCGCSLSSHDNSAMSNQQLSWGLVARNLVLALLALAPALAVSARPLLLLDHLLLLLSLPIMLLCYSAVNQLLANGGAIASWRNT